MHAQPSFDSSLALSLAFHATPRCTWPAQRKWETELDSIRSVNASWVPDRLVSRTNRATCCAVRGVGLSAAEGGTPEEMVSPHLFGERLRAKLTLTLYTILGRRYWCWLKVENLDYKLGRFGVCRAASPRADSCVSFFLRPSSLALTVLNISSANTQIPF